MTTSIGTPVFTTVGGDVSAATVSPDGGKTSQTLAALSQGQNTLAGSIADAVQDASDAKAEATQASSDAADAKTIVSDLAGTAVTTDQANVANGYAALDGAGCPNIPGNYITFGDGTGMPTLQFKEGNAPSGNPLSLKVWVELANNEAWLSLNAPYAGSTKGGLCADGPGQCVLGKADNYFDTAYLGSAVNVVSDAKDKTVAGSFDDLTYEQAQKLSDAVFSVAVKIFQLNSAIAEKGADKARYHVGMIAQEIEAAITAAGLDPAKYAMWTSTPVTQLVEKDTGQKDKEGNAIMTYEVVPVYEADGKTQKTQQMLRYEQVLCTLFAGAKSRIATLIKDVSDLTTRVVALEAKASGSAA
ncbi:tail fiber domain-containing protein [Acetobacter senegalensis]|uniref:tail fiber domain-containing protein n=1 Tax=Acetobacter senegalensis TaxID=446692 RepID=UPI001EDC2D19|nr:tail fiber domain-containing protein [Acetobacter senegalensis]MCG4271733.1 tail fiber domain-containing protein [Acetobacter senegalensis]